jgi:ribosomal peptide maturation radical SAM protein 1
MRFRSKSPEVVARELATLARAHGTLSFSAVDNIVELQYLKTLFPHIVTEGKDYRIFYEIKSNLTREQVKALREAGVNAIQPGIESLNTHVLSLMRKGVTAIQNVNLLRWATYYGIYVGWNVLWGFPGERDQDYVEQAQLVRHLTHLRPPSMAGVRILLERFSPLFFDREAFPIEFMRPEVSYSYVYPKAVDLFKVAYFFEYKLRNTLPPEVYVDLHSNLLQWIDAWAAPGGSASHEEGTPGTSGPSGFSPPRLTFAYSDDLVQISDFRRKRPVLRTIEGELARLYKAASDRPTSAARAIETGRLKLSVDALEHAVDEFCDQGIMMRDGSKFLSLALPASPDR